MTQYLVVYEQGESSWGAYAPDLPGVYAVGETREQTEELISEAIPAHIALLRQRDRSVPQPHHAAGIVSSS